LSDFEKGQIFGATLLAVSRTTVSKGMPGKTNHKKTTSAKRNSEQKLTERNRRTFRRIVSKNRRTTTAQVPGLHLEDPVSTRKKKLTD
jgi:hypothetical protein